MKQIAYLTMVFLPATFIAVSTKFRLIWVSSHAYYLASLPSE
jgi:hypothetical protein